MHSHIQKETQKKEAALKQQQERVAALEEKADSVTPNVTVNTDNTTAADGSRNDETPREELSSSSEPTTATPEQQCNTSDTSATETSK